MTIFLIFGPMKRLGTDIPDTTMAHNLGLLQTWEYLEWDGEDIASFTIFKTQDPSKTWSTLHIESRQNSRLNAFEVG